MNATADGNENVTESQAALGTCMPKTTCGAGKVCGGWSGYAECGFSACTPGSEVRALPGRGGNGYYGSSVHTSQRTRNCTMPGGWTCIEVQLSYNEYCDCDGGAVVRAP